MVYVTVIGDHEKEYVGVGVREKGCGIWVCSM